jgi:DNA polymerase-3 subunit gamma/tau
MPNLITYRPTSFNGIVGQPRAIKIVTAVLNTARFMPRGFVLEGVKGVGKTSVGYLLARALMCLEEPLGCGRCASCKTIVDHGIDQHPDFSEVDGASNNGVDHARNILLQSEALPILGKRRIIMVDEAHNMSSQAWDIYLKPLEAQDTNSIFIFVSSNGDKIPGTIRSRCAKARFQRIPEDILLGLLCNAATDHSIPYDLEAMKLIARNSVGIVRDAYMTLSTVASMGLVTKDLVQAVIDTSLEEICTKIYLQMMKGDQTEAVRLCDEACGANSPAKVIEAMFETYGRVVFKPDTVTYQTIRNGFTNVSQVTSILIKWSLSTNLPLEALPIFIFELMSVLRREDTGQLQKTPVYSHPTPVAESTPDTLSVRELLQLTGGSLEKI